MAAYQSEMKHNLDSLRLVIALFCFGGLVGAYMAIPLQTVNQYCTAVITSSSAS